MTVKGTGRGGRCQEFALAAARDLTRAARITVLPAGPDGSAGPTDAAGAIIDADSVTRGARAGGDARRAMEENDAYGFLTASGDLIVSGATRTNLLDLYVVLRA